MKILSAQNLYTMKHNLFEFTGKWKELLGAPPVNGVWIIQGKEKHGKTAFTLSLVKYLSNFEKVWYISAEEGTDALFIEAVRRAEIPSTPKIGFTGYVEIEELNAKLKKRNAAKIVVIDNMTMYMDAFKQNGIINFMSKHKNILLIFISHEERGEPATGAGRYVKKLAKVIVKVEGLQAHIGGRCPGGTMLIHEEGAQRYGIVE